ncbi:hypothetical protein, partial [Erwinia amylovora]|uniref:hypothetical protein n=1 Tax=Erwinia amylovora TaxID=552 RepID=UPI0019649DA8
YRLIADICLTRLSLSEQTEKGASALFFLHAFQDAVGHTQKSNITVALSKNVRIIRGPANRVWRNLI